MLPLTWLPRCLQASGLLEQMCPQVSALPALLHAGACLPACLSPGQAAWRECRSNLQGASLCSLVPCTAVASFSDTTAAMHVIMGLDTNHDFSLLQSFWGASRAQTG